MILLALAGLTMQAEPDLYMPTSPWSVAPVAGNCSAGRSFGGGKRSIFMQIRPALVSGKFELALVGPRSAVPATTPGKPASVAIDAAQAMPMFGFAQPTADGRVLYTGNIDRSLFASLAPSARILTIADGGASLAISIEGLGAAISALNECIYRRLAEWGVDPARLRDQQLATLLNPGRFFGASFRPRSASGKALSGRVVTLIRVGTDDEMVDCRPVDAASEELGSQVCAVVKERVRARSAKNAAGQPIESYAFLPVNVID